MAYRARAYSRYRAHPRHRPQSRRRTLDPAWTEEYNRRIAHPSWEARRNEYYATHKYQCRGCHRRHNLNLHHKSYRHLWHERDRDLVYACLRCHKHIHTIQHRAFPGTHFALRTISNYYLLQRLSIHYLGLLAFILFTTCTIALATTYGGLAYFAPDTLARVNQCIILRVQYQPVTPSQQSLCKW